MINSLMAVVGFLAVLLIGCHFYCEPMRGEVGGSMMAVRFYMDKFGRALIKVFPFRNITVAKNLTVNS